MNLLVKFAATDVREELIDRLRARRPDILSNYTPARTLPHAIFENLDAGQVNEVRECSKGLGEVFEDIQFEPFKGL